MKQNWLKQLLPHFIAILLFVVVAAIYCKPALEGKVLEQHDIIGMKGMAQNSFEYNDKHGKYPLWNPNMFSGMPNYQILIGGKSALPDMYQLIALGLPKPINFFFIAAICFYLLCLALRVRPIVGILGSLAYAFATYNPVIIAAGHDTKMLVIGLIPMLIAGLIWIYNKHYWLGLAVTTLGAYFTISANHPQVIYYFLIVMLAFSVGYFVKWIKNKEFKHIGISAGIALTAALVGVSVSAMVLFTTKEYTNYTMRGGKSVEVKGDSIQAANTSGLDADYAFRYSLSKAEPLVVMMPKAFGESSLNRLGEGSGTAQRLAALGVPQAQADQFAANLPAYWGGMSLPGEWTSGPPYSGALICLLALLGFVFIKHPMRWGLLAASLISIILSWGKFFPSINLFLLEHLPLYNKFRAPSMALVMVQFTLPLMAVLASQFFFFTEKGKELLATHFKRILYTTGGLIGLLGIMYLVMDYGSPGDSFLYDQLKGGGLTDDMAAATISGLKNDRQNMFGSQVLRTLGFALLVIGILWAFSKKYITALIATSILGIVVLIDLLVIDSKFLNKGNYIDKDLFELQHFRKTPIDEQILQDTDPNFRVYNITGDAFNESKTSYHHKSIGGYHAAKLRLYQDVIEKYLSGNLNFEVLNALNAKYIITQNPQTRQQALMPNTEVYGNAWFVKNVRFVKNDVEELQAIGNTHLRDTAIVQETFASSVVAPQWDSTATIKLTQYDNDRIDYESNSLSSQFAVFSEIYYPAGWNAYIDGNKADYVKTNYMLRGLTIPAGKHQISFVFEPDSYRKGNNIAFIGSLLIYVLVIGGFFMAWRTNKKHSITQA